MLSDRHLRKTVQEKCMNPRLTSPERGQILSPSIDLDTLLWSTGANWVLNIKTTIIVKT